MARKREEIAQLLATKFQAESVRLKSWGTKTDDKAAISFAMRVVDFVLSLMAESRYRELKRVNKKLKRELLGDDAADYIKERLKATKQMSAAIQRYGEKKESERPFGRKEKKHKHHHHHHKERK
jgi:hypothetical protein